MVTKTLTETESAIYRGSSNFTYQFDCQKSHNMIVYKVSKVVSSTPNGGSYSKSQISPNYTINVYGTTEDQTYRVILEKHDPEGKIVLASKSVWCDPLKYEKTDSSDELKTMFNNAVDVLARSISKTVMEDNPSILKGRTTLLDSGADHVTNMLLVVELTNLRDIMREASKCFPNIK